MVWLPCGGGGPRRRPCFGVQAFRQMPDRSRRTQRAEAKASPAFQSRLEEAASKVQKLRIGLGA